MSKLFSLSWRFGRHVCQLKRIHFQFCKHDGSSRGMRDFINTHVVEFAEKNPGIAVYVTPRKHRHPRLVANYMNGHNKNICVKNMTPEQIDEWITRLQSESGLPWREERLRKSWFTDKPSIQGTWHPFLNKPPIDLRNVEEKS